MSAYYWLIVVTTVVVLICVEKFAAAASFSVGVLAAQFIFSYFWPQDSVKSSEHR